MPLRILLTAAAVYTALAGLAFVLAPQAAGAGARSPPTPPRR